MTKLFDENRDDLDWIEVGLISVVWTNSQRPFDERHAKRIADNFNREKFDPVKVTLPNGDGIYHACDGQHRVGAVKMLAGDREKIPCQVLPEGNPARAAQLFLGINTGRKRPQPIDLFKVGVTANNETEVAVNRIVTRMGYLVGHGHGNKGIMAVAALTSVYRKQGSGVLESALKIIQATWGMDPNAVVSPIIHGYGAFLGEYGSEVNWQRLKDVVKKKFTPGSLVAAARNMREMHGGGMMDAMKDVLLAHYNKGSREKLK